MESISERDCEQTATKCTDKTMGTEKSHFLAGVYCSPSSICSHMVNSSYAPPCREFSNGIPVTQWNMRYDTWKQGVVNGHPDCENLVEHIRLGISS
jgi:hypothetical protein